MDNRERLFSKMARHGATQVEPQKLFKESQITWTLGPDDEASEICIRLEEFMANAARNSRRALQVADRIRGVGETRDSDLFTALKKYVEDAGQSIKEVDSTLIKNGSNLESLLIEIPNRSSDAELSWRNLMGRRDVIAHRLLTVDNARVYQEARRDFGFLDQLLSRVYFSPIKTDIVNNEGITGLDIKSEAFRSLSPSKAGQTPSIGQSLIFVCDDRHRGFISYRFGKGENDQLMLATSFIDVPHLAIYGRGAQQHQ